MSASNTWLRFISLPAAFFPWLGHDVEKRAQTVEADGPELESKPCHSLSRVTLAGLLTSLSFHILIIHLIWGLNEIEHIKSIAYVDIQKVLILVSPSPDLEAGSKLSFTGHFISDGFTQSTQTGCEDSRFSGVHLWGIPQGKGPGRDQLNPRDIRAVWASLWAMSFGIVGIGESSKSRPLPKSSCLQRGGCTSQAASRISRWTALRTSTWNAGCRQSPPSPLRTSPFIVVLSPCMTGRSSRPHLVSSSLHLRDISLLCVPINGQLSTHFSTTLFWRSVTDPMLCDPSCSAHWGAFPSSLHLPHSWRCGFPNTALAMPLSGLKPLMASHSLLNQAQTRAAAWFLPPLPLFTCLHLGLLPPCPPHSPAPSLSLLLCALGWPRPFSVDCLSTAVWVLGRALGPGGQRRQILVLEQMLPAPGLLSDITPPCLTFPPTALSAWASLNSFL